MPKRGSKRKKSRTQTEIPEGAQVSSDNNNVPRSLVVRGSKISSNVHDLILDLRKLMSPNTASNLREQSFNKVRDFISVSGQLSLTHILLLSQTESSLVLKIARFGSGPTLHFKIREFCNAKHVRISQKKTFESPLLYNSSPLVVLHNFNNIEENHVKLMRTVFQHMFPSINVKAVKLTECRRVALFHFNKDNNTVELRHYAIKASPVGINKSIKKILQAKIPNLSQLADVSLFVEGSTGFISDSEVEEEGSKVLLPDRFVGRGNARSQQCSMKLIEIGPRMTLELFKVERNIFEGEVLYHKYQQKTEIEIKQLNDRIEKKKLIKLKRKQIQDENVKRKQELIDASENRKKAKFEKYAAANNINDGSSDTDKDLQ